jgi:uncharacterized protein
MSLDDIRSMFLSIKSYAVRHRLKKASLVWHGGEPFMVPLDVWNEITRIKEEVFSDIADFCAIESVVQTNLTILTPAYVEALRARAPFEEIGVSFDVFGGQRVDVKGGDSTGKVLRNMQLLIDNNIDFGAICVVSAQSVDRLRAIYDFFESIGVFLRFLPFYMSASEGQVENHAVDYERLKKAMCDVFDRMMVSDDPVDVLPLTEYMDYAISFLMAKRRAMFDPEIDETVLIVDLDGTIYGPAEAYNPMAAYGNIFREDLTSIMSSEGRRVAVEAAKSRIQKHCRDCRYYERCPGFFAADSTGENRVMLENGDCLARGIIDHIVLRLKQTGISNEIRSLRSRLRHKNHMPVL